MRVHVRTCACESLTHSVNVTAGEPRERMLMTGMHTVCDIHCCGCKNVVGWKYQRASAASQRYKVGKFIVEKHRLFVEEESF